MASSSRRGVRSNTRNKKDGWDEAGGYMNAKIQKLEDQFVNETSESGEKKISDIFKGISIFVNGYTKPPSDTLKKLMQQHGGVYHHYYSRDKVTHTVATNLPNSKIAALTDKKVVKPEWIMDSIRAKKLLSYEDYLLYTSKSKVQPSLKSQFSHQKNIRKNEESNSTASTNSSLFNTSKDVFSSNQTITESNKDTILEGIQDEIVDNEDSDDDMFDDDVEESNQSLQPIIKSNTDHPKEIIQILCSEKENQQQKVEVESGFKTNSASKEQTYKSPAKAVDANFVAEFYSHSRLHHIATSGAEFKAYVNTLQAKVSDFPAKLKLQQMVNESSENELQDQTSGRVIMHIDMDCFFVSVGLRNRPHLKGKPVAVTHSRGNGAKTSPNKSSDGEFISMAEIASCSYEARKCGVKNGMLMGPARKLCPDLVPIPYDFEGYNEVSKCLYDTIASLTVDVEAVSCDELFVDCTAVLEETGATPLQLASMIRKDVETVTQCTASAGLGPNMLVARLATKKAKPNGQCYIKTDEVALFMQNQPIENIPGIGRKLKPKFDDLKIVTCGDLQSFPLATLQKYFGPKTAETFHKFSRGADDRVIQSEKIRKSVSAEINYGIRFTGWDQANKFVNEVAEEVSKRLKAIDSIGKTITVKLKIRSADAPKETAKFLGHGKCDSVSKAFTLPMATDNKDIIAKHTLTILRSINPDVTDIRGLGIQITRLEKQIGGKKGGVGNILQYACKLSELSVETVEVPSKTKKSKESSPYDVKEDDQQNHDTADDTDLATTTKSTLLPPLPCLPDILSPSPRLLKLAFNYSQSNSSMIKTPEDSTPGSTSSNNKTIQCTSNSVFPSPSQIDPEILAALPEDIKREILAEQNRLYNDSKNQELQATKSDQTNQNLAPKVIETSEEGAGCSHWEDIVTNASSPSKFLNLNMLKQAPSPSKSPGRGRGRPKASITKNSPYNAGKFKVPQANPPHRKSHPKKQLFVDEEGEQDVDKSNEKDVTKFDEEPSLPVQIQPAKPNLCGATQLNDVKALIKEWISESSEPNEEDTLHFLTYLTELLEDKDLEQLLFTLRHLISFLHNQVKVAFDQVLKPPKQAKINFKNEFSQINKYYIVDRQASRCTNQKWRLAANEIVEHIQVSVKTMYGSTLKIEV